MRIRPARLSDLSRLVAIEGAAFATDRLSRRSFRTLMTRGSARLIVADGDTDIVGYALILTRRGTRTARLYSLAVAPGQGGRGVGAALLTAAEALARDGGADRFSLEVRADNERARRLYENRGYQLNGAIARYYADGETACRYERALRPSPGDAAAGRARYRGRDG